jgi:TPR repeat protein
MAMLKAFGSSVPNFYAAADLLKLSSAQGHADSQAFLATLYHEGKGVIQDDREALKLYNAAAAGGSASAQNSLGVIHRDGVEVPRNFQEAEKWFRKSAEGGNLSGQANYGSLLHSAGRYSEAFIWCQKAALRGDATSQYNMALMYNSGLGVLASRVLAYAWVNLAASGQEKIPQAQRLRDSMERTLSYPQVVRAQAETAKLKELIKPE